jgi:A/G-specific adenine glycosylase
MAERTPNSKLRTPNLNRLVPALLGWFAQNARDLPWRRTRDPYAIWVSEIMLQQTQVKTVIPYWKSWMRELPTIEAVAEARSEKIHKLWEGLGYYTRARNLQKAAKQIIAQKKINSKSSRRRGDESQIKRKSDTPSAFTRLRRDKHVVSYKFPDNFDDVLALPGIGRYTAGAICSIAFNQPTPILDGNVIRVMTRVFGIGKNPREKKTNAQLWQLAELLVASAAKHRAPRSSRRKEAHSKIANSQSLLTSAATIAGNCSSLNQSLMELGALVCTPRNPQCEICPVKKLCIAFREGRIGELPNLVKREAAIARRFAAFVVERNGRFLVRQRPAGAVNAHLWEFPNMEIHPNPSSSGHQSAHYSCKKSQSRLTSAATVQKSDLEIIRAAKNLGISTLVLHPLCTVKHYITRYRITLEAFRVHLGGTSYTSPHPKGIKSGTRITRPSENNGVWLTLAKLNSLAFTSAHRKILRAIETFKNLPRFVRSPAFRRS